MEMELNRHQIFIFQKNLLILTLKSQQCWWECYKTHHYTIRLEDLRSQKKEEILYLCKWLKTTT